MTRLHEDRFADLARNLVGPSRWSLLERVQLVPSKLLGGAGDLCRFDRSELAMGLAVGLLIDLCERVPLAAAYLLERGIARENFFFDHGAMRTIALPSGELPLGRESVARILIPLGYELSETYPLDRLGMTGYVYTHLDHPELLPQYFVSELEPEHFSETFRETLGGLTATSVDPLSEHSKNALRRIERGETLSAEDAEPLLRALVQAFGRTHREPTVEEYELLMTESAEAAWIATEGHSFNHITDRVDDVAAVAHRERDRGRPVKDRLETSRSGRVIQTALRATQVERLFRTKDGVVTRMVPGSFLEFISREQLDDGSLDLAFDASNAQGIFKMTDSREVPSS